MKASRTDRTDKKGALERAYSSALAEYLAMGNENALRNAYEFGRTALAQGWGILDVAGIHHSCVARMMVRMNASASLTQDLERTQQFFEESLSPYEMAHRGLRDAASALRRLNETLEQEVQRIAHAVHDEAGQLLFAARLAMDGIARELDASASGRLQEICVIFDEVEKQLRRLSHELRPSILDDLGLLPAVEFLTNKISKSAELSIQIHCTLKSRCTTAIETAMYRVIQEALTNIAKHAQAKNVEIRLRRVAKNLNCLIHDDGKGFDVPAVLSSSMHKGLGLIGMRERLNAVGGTLVIDSVVGRGTNLLVNIPWRNR
ncbi:MAG: ATP-binding protein [Terracidiphilus sp.]